MSLLDGFERKEIRLYLFHRMKTSSVCSFWSGLSY